MLNYKIYFLLLLPIIFFGCRKNASGSGGKAQINGFVEYQGNKVSKNTVVYIKYGATSFPGTDISQYDSQQNVDSQGNFVFGTLFEGDYYLYATGSYIDSYNFIKTVTGGIHVTISTRKANLNYDIAVN